MKFIPAAEHHYAAIGNLVTSAEELYLVYPNGKFPWDSEQLTTIASKRHRLTVGMINNQVAAFANIYDLVPQQSAFIGNVIIARAHRGKGFGKALINHMTHICRDTYQAIPHISVFNNNTRALLLYTALGFSPYAVESKLDLNNDKVALIHMKHA
jgi:ribosomal protein S18 acetylase RimI-like enzyme